MIHQLWSSHEMNQSNSYCLLWSLWWWCSKMNQHHESGEIGKEFNAPLNKEGLFDTPVVKFSWNDSYCMHGHLWMSLCAHDHDIARAFRKQRTISQHKQNSAYYWLFNLPQWRVIEESFYDATCDVEDDSVFRTLCRKVVM